ncbi:MAG: M48 family metalloprotease [Tepidisphaerales bacterium]
MTPSLPPAGDSGPDVFSNQQREILQAVDVIVPQVQVPRGYGVYLGFLAAALMLMPPLYLAMLAFLAWLAVWHTWQAFASMEYGPFFIFHFPMAGLGALLLLFLIKPVFLRQREDSGRIVTLRPQDEPLLFAFVRKLCSASGAPVPSRIEVDCEANASASLDRGLAGRKLVLRIGLPLVAALPVRQLAGILAHEFGHFTQRSGMTGSYLIRRLNRFFARIVFERDRLDARLQRMRLSRNVLARGFYYVAAGLVEAARGVLWLMLVVAELLTCSVLRRMEYDADQREAHVAGTRDFEYTSQLLVFLDVAGHQSRYQLTHTWDQRRLADDLPQLIYANARRLSEQRDDIVKLLGTGKTHWFDTHPSHNDRVRSVEKLGAPGLVECDLPASQLFADFGAVCRRTSEALYRSVFAKEFAEAKLVPTAVMLGEFDGCRDAFKALNRYFQGCVASFRPVFPADDAQQEPDDVDAASRALAAQRQAMLAAARQADDALEPFEKASERIAVARSEVALCRMFVHSPQAQSLRAKAERELEQHQPVHNMAEEKLVEFELAARRRLTTGLRLLRTDSLAARLPEARHGREEAARLVEVCRALAPCMAPVRKMRELALSIQIFCSAHNPRQPHQALVSRILETTRQTGMMLRELKERLEMVAYPFEHATEGISVGAAVVQRMPEPEDPIDAHACVMGMLESFTGLAHRAIAVLAGWAEKVELAIGLEPLPEPKEKEQTEPARQAMDNKRDERRYWLWYGVRAAAGVAMLVILVWFSIDPPILPSMPWMSSSGDGLGYRPAAFQVPMRSSNAPSEPMIYPPGYQQWQQQHPGYGTPGHPGAPQPGQPHQPGQPYGPGQPNVPGQPYTPGQPNPPAQPYAPGQPYPARPQPGQPYPARPGQPGYNPNQPGYNRPQPQPNNPQPYRPGPSSPGRSSPSPGGGPRGR